MSTETLSLTEAEQALDLLAEIFNMGDYNTRGEYTKNGEPYPCCMLCHAKGGWDGHIDHTSTCTFTRSMELLEKHNRVTLKFGVRKAIVRKEMAGI